MLRLLICHRLTGSRSASRIWWTICGTSCACSTGELRRAICGLGDLQLAPPFQHHRVSQIRWNAMTEDAKQRAVGKLMSDTGVRMAIQRTVTSTDGNVTVTGSRKIARKKGQRRRPAAERSTKRKM